MKGNCFCYLFPSLAWLVKCLCYVVCFGSPLAAASAFGTGAAGPLAVWLSAYCLGCFLCKWLNMFVVLPPDLQTVFVQTLQITFACAWSVAENLNQFQIMEVEFFFSDQLIRLAFSHGSPCGYYYTHTNKEALWLVGQVDNVIRLVRRCISAQLQFIECAQDNPTIFAVWQIVFTL